MSADFSAEGIAGLEAGSRLLRLKDRFMPAGSFAESALTVLTGTALAQAIPIAAAPLLTRLYAPADFGLFALYLSLTAIVGTVATARYELAIMLPEREEDGFNVAAASILIAAGVSLLTLLAVWRLNAPITRILGNPRIAPWLYFAPLTVLLAGVFQTLTYWALRRKQFKLLAVRRATFAGGMIAAQLGLAQAGARRAGLLFGMIAGDAVATGLFAWKVRAEDWGRLKHALSRPVMKSLLWRYRDFPRYDIPSSLINALANQMPTLLFSAFFGPVVAGLYALTNRVLSIPVSLLARSILDVYKQRATSDFIRDGNCEALYVKTFFSLAVLAFPPFALLAAVGPPLFVLAFGEKWRTAGEFARILAGFYFVQFVASPLSYTVFIAEKQKLHLLWQIALLVSTSAALLFGVYVGSAKAALSAFGAVYVLLYLVSLGMSYHFAKGRAR